jgi:hypothetical protein
MLAMSEPAVEPETTSWLRDSEILLHIGVHKTGTTAVQAALAAARPKLAELDVTYAGRTVSHYHAAAAVTGRRLGWEKGGRNVDIARWEKLAAQVREIPGKVVLSSEVFCEAEPDVARRIVADLGRERVRVLVTLRPLEDLMPSTWQQYVKSGVAMPYGTWLRKVLHGPGEAKTTPSFWKRNDHGAQVQKWVDVVGPENVAVLVVDTSRPTALYESFEDIIGLPRGILVKDETAPSNRSLSAAEVEVIRRLNAEVRSTMDYSAYHRLVRRGAILNLVENRRPAPGEAKLTTPGWAVEKARVFSRKSVDDIKASGATVFGDLEMLVPTSALPSSGVTVPEDVSDEAAVMLMIGLLDAAVGAEEKQKEQGAVASTAGLAIVPRKALVDELARRARKRLPKVRRG